MQRQSNSSRGDRPGRSSSAGAGVLDRPITGTDEARKEGLLQEILRLAEAAHAGRLTERGRADRFDGDHRKLIEAVNDMLDEMAEKIFWYEQILDSIPFPLSVTDSKMNRTFINRPVEELLGIRRADVVGKQCSNWGAAICGRRTAALIGCAKANW